MSQSNIIAFCLIIAFVVFITMRGELGNYINFFTGSNKGVS